MPLDARVDHLTIYQKRIDLALGATLTLGHDKLYHVINFQGIQFETSGDSMKWSVKLEGSQWVLLPSIAIVAVTDAVALWSNEWGILDAVS